jgi:general secretion pathway protein J
MLRLSSSKLMRTSGIGGFTLIEILVAITILAIVLTSVYGIFGSVSAAKTRLDRDSTDYHTARVVFDRFSRELHGTYYRGDDQTTFFRGGRDNNGETFLELTTTAVTPLSAVGTGIAEVRYRLEADEESSNELMILMRGEKPRQSSTMLHDDRMMRLAPGIERLTVRFYSAGQWHNEWDASQKGLPQLVEITMIVSQEGDRQVPFSTTFEISDVSTL